MATKKPAKVAVTPKVNVTVKAAEVEEPKAPKPKYAPDDNSIDARMWRLLQEHKAMGAR